MFFTRLREAILFARASDLAQRGDVRRALSVLERLRDPHHNKAVVEALRAYLQIMTEKTDDARLSVQRSRRYNELQTCNALFTDTYCDYLDAILDNRIADWNHLALELTKFPGSPRARSFLVIDRPLPLQ